jgi:hypothetical protein
LIYVGHLCRTVYFKCMFKRLLKQMCKYPYKNNQTSWCNRFTWLTSDKHIFIYILTEIQTQRWQSKNCDICTSIVKPRYLSIYENKDIFAHTKHYVVHLFAYIPIVIKYGCHISDGKQYFFADNNHLFSLHWTFILYITLTLSLGMHGFVNGSF